MRIVGLLGVLALLPINIFGLAVAWNERDLRGVVLMLFMTGMLILFSFVLLRGRKLARTAGAERLAPGWAGEPVSSFARHVLARTLEGRIYLVGAAASATVAILCILCPEVLGISAAKATGQAILFGLWPIVSFTLYVKVCGPTYESSLFKAVLVLVVSAFPFYVAYR